MRFSRGFFRENHEAFEKDVEDFSIDCLEGEQRWYRVDYAL